MQCYEITFVLRPDMSTQEVDALATEMKELLEKLGGKVVKQESWGLRKLAYLINKMSRGHYIFFGAQVNAEALTEFQRNLGLNENVIRHMTVKVDAIEEGPSAPIRQDEEREYNAA